MPLYPQVFDYHQPTSHHSSFFKRLGDFSLGLLFALPIALVPVILYLLLGHRIEYFCMRHGFFGLSIFALGLLVTLSAIILAVRRRFIFAGFLAATGLALISWGLVFHAVAYGST